MLHFIGIFALLRWSEREPAVIAKVCMYFLVKPQLDVLIASVSFPEEPIARILVCMYSYN